MINDDLLPKKVDGLKNNSLHKSNQIKIDGVQMLFTDRSNSILFNYTV